MGCEPRGSGFSPSGAFARGGRSRSSGRGSRGRDGPLHHRPFKASVNEGSSILPTQEAVSDLVSDVNHEGRVTGTRPDG